MLQNYSKIYGSSDLVTVYTGPITPSAINTHIFTWSKPKGVRKISILAVGGGGGGGGGGASSTAGTARSGGAGGSSGAVGKAEFDAAFLPDALYIQPGSAGQGAIAGSGTGGTGGNGGVSYVSIAPDITAAMNCVVYAGGGNGGVGGSTANSTAGTAGTIGSQALMPIGFALAKIHLLAGQQGGTCNTGSAGNAVTPFTAGPAICTGGGAGGGLTGPGAAAAGGGITTAGVWPTVAGGSTSPLTAGDNGLLHGLNLNANTLDFITSRYPLMSTGGGGGAANSAGNGASGGGGGFGSGGGGGGASFGVGALGGAGGNGGPGLIVITCTY